MLNDYYQNIGMKGFIQRYGIVNAVKRGAFMFIKLHLVKDYEVRKVLWQERASTKIKPYLKYKDTDVEGLSFPKNDVENPIWIYWNKGIEQAPIIVQKCYESVCKHSNQKIILLNDQNLADYIRLPEYIEKKKDAGQIPMAGYADLMRFALLEHYGGTWIDSTVYLTNKLPEYITKSDLFAFQDSFGLIRNPALMSVWLLHSTPHNEVIRKTRNVAFKYWENQSYVVEYLLPYIILTMVLEQHPETFSKMPYANSDYTHLMLEHINEKYDENLMNHILSLSSVHKLSYKLKEEAYTNKDNLYHRIVVC